MIPTWFECNIKGFYDKENKDIFNVTEQGPIIPVNNRPLYHYNPHGLGGCCVTYNLIEESQKDEIPCQKISYSRSKIKRIRRQKRKLL